MERSLGQSGKASAAIAGPSQTSHSLQRRFFGHRNARWLLGARAGFPRSGQHVPEHSASSGPQARSGLSAAPSHSVATDVSMASDGCQDPALPPLERQPPLPKVSQWRPALPALPPQHALPALQQQQQQQATHSVLALAAAWDQLAPRLPLQTGLGKGAELILNALKLSLAASSSSGGGSSHASRALGVGLRLADLASSGLPLDAEAIAAGILAEALCRGGGSEGGMLGQGTAPLQPALQLIEQRVGPTVAHLVHDVLRVRALPSRVDLYDDEAASALRELCLSFYDVRATAVEVAARLEGLAALAGAPAPKYERQVAALEALQIYAPLGHALGMGRLTAHLEDCCFQLLFPESYARTAAWLRSESAAGQELLERCQAAIRAEVLGNPRFYELAGGLQVQGRTKSLFSTLKKLLRLGETSRGGRSRAEIYDLMGIRLVVLPREDLPREEAEEAAAKACYLVRDAVHSLWETIPGRSKDYIAAPKENGYQSLHSTLRVRAEGAEGSLAEGGEADSSGMSTLELQIRTQAMHDLAEMGQAAHAAYKGGLAASQARQLRAWTDARHSLAAAAAAAAGPPAPRGPSAGEVLFSHLDLDGDGRLSLEELREALAELGAGGVGGAEELMAWVDSDADGTIDLDEFLVFHEKAGLMRALKEVDHDTAEQLENHVHQGEHPAATTTTSSSSSSGSGGGSVCTAVGGAQRGGLPPPTGYLPLRAASPWAAARRGLFRWAAHNSPAASAMHVHGSGASGSSSSGGGAKPQREGLQGPLPRRLVSTAVTAEVLSAASASSSSSMDYELEHDQPGTIVTHGTAQRGRSSSRHGSVQQPANGMPRQHGLPNGGPARRGQDGHQAAHVATPEPSRSNSQASAADASPRMAEGAAAAAASSSNNNSSDANSSSSSSSSSSKESGRSSSPMVARALSNAMRPILRVWQQNRQLPAAAVWGLVPAPGNHHPLTGAVGQPLPAISLPPQGPCIIGAVRERGCDVVLDLPTVSGRHARLWVQRRTSVNSSQLFVTDVGSTNGTWVNRYRIKPWKDVPLYPGDLVQFADPDVGFIVRLGPTGTPVLTTGQSPSAGATAAATNAVAAAAAAAAAPAAEGEAPAVWGAPAPLPPAVEAALAVASAVEAAAVAAGVFPAPADGAMSGVDEVAQRARALMASGDFIPARMLLLGEVMRQPLNGGLWAQLANLERNMAIRSSRGPPAAGPPSCGSARAFYGAAAACYAAPQESEDPGACQGLCRALSSWAQMEYSEGNDRAGRSLFRLAVKAAQQQQQQQVVEGAGTSYPVDIPRLLFTFAHKEWKKGDAGLAAVLAKQALALEPTNSYALALLGNIQAEAGRVSAARALFQSAVEADPQYVTALQSWARLEARAGGLEAARQLFGAALRLEPTNTFVLQAWAVAEGREGYVSDARALFARCLDVDPGCRKALHAWAKLEEEAGEVEKARELYGRVLKLKPNSVETLSALGHLERLAGQEAVAEGYLTAALRKDPRSASALHELALLREAQGAVEEATRLERQVQQVNGARRTQLKAAGNTRKKGGNKGGSQAAPHKLL